MSLNHLIKMVIFFGTPSLLGLRKLGFIGDPAQHISRHPDFVSLEALWLSCQCHFMTSDQLMPFTDSILLFFYNFLGVKGGCRGHAALPKAIQ